MKSEGIKPGLIVYTCLIQTCIRAKELAQATVLFYEMKKQGIMPDSVIYMTVINSYINTQWYDHALDVILESLRTTKCTLDRQAAEGILGKLTLLCYDENCHLHKQRPGDIQLALEGLR